MWMVSDIRHSVLRDARYCRVIGYADLVAKVPPPPRGGGTGETQGTAAPCGRTRQIVAVLAALLIAVALTGCGKKGAPQPPPDEPNTFPRSYPNV